MVKLVNLKKGAYESAKISSKRGKLLGDEKVNEFVKYSFNVGLKYLEEHGFRESVDSSFLQFKGFYLIERVFNTHTSRIYKKIFTSASKENKILLNAYYLKYQIHNTMVLVRCYISKEKDIEPYLIGDERRKAKYTKAFEMPNLEDALTYISKKLGFNSEEVLSAHKKGVYELENYLYKKYYEKLMNFKFKYNNLDEKKFFDFIRTYIDLINSRTVIRLKIENIKTLNFKDVYIEGGNLNLGFFEDLASSELNTALNKINEHFGKIEKTENSNAISEIDKRISIHKTKGNKILGSVHFGSPFFSLKYLFEVEKEINKLRTILKAKYLGLKESEIRGLIEWTKLLLLEMKSSH